MNKVKFTPETLDLTMRKLLGCADGNHEWELVSTHAGDPIYKCKFCGEIQPFISGSASGMATWSSLVSTVSWAVTSTSS